MGISKGLAKVAGRLRSGRHPQHRTGRTRFIRDGSPSLREAFTGITEQELVKAYSTEPAPVHPKYIKYKGRWVLSVRYRIDHPRAKPIRREIEALKKDNRRTHRDFVRHGHKFK
jgi:hypothetical protein